MKRAIIVLLATSLGVAPAQAIELREVIIRALEVDPRLEEARHRSREAALLADAARADRLPTASAGHRSTRLDDQTVERSNSAADGLSQFLGVEIPPFVYASSHRTEIEVNAPLWTSGALSAGLESAVAGLDEALSSEAVLERSIAFETLGLFLDSLASSARLVSSEATLARAGERLREAENRLTLGLGTRHETSRWRVELANSRAALATDQVTARTDRLALAALLEWPEAQLEELATPLPQLRVAFESWAAELDLEALIAASPQIAASRPELDLVAARRSRAAAETRRSRAGTRPRVDAAVTMGWLENQSLAPDEFFNWSASLVVSMPLDLNRAITRRQRAAVQGELAHAAAERTEIKRRALELTIAAAEMKAGISRLEASREALAEARQRRELVDRQRGAGLASLLDLVDADQLLSASETAVIDSELAFYRSLAAVELAWPEAELPAGGLLP